jgi:hypothetical protein
LTPIIAFFKQYSLESNSRVVQLVCQTFEALKKLANFDAQLPKGEGKVVGEDNDSKPPATDKGSQRLDEGVGLNLSYTINLVLPKTDDPAVFNAIFRSLRDNLLRK